jgi:hypothetical protein
LIPEQYRLLHVDSIVPSDLKNAQYGVASGAPREPNEPILNSTEEDNGGRNEVP